MFTLFVQILGDFVVTMVALADPNRNEIAMATSAVFGIITTTIAVVNIMDVARDLRFNKRPLHQNKEEWLITASKIFTTFGVISYYIGDNLPEILSEFTTELNCDALCAERGLIAGVYFLFLSLTTFSFLPEIFRKINKIINEEYTVHHMKQDEFKEYQLQYFVLRMLALILDFDTVYTGVWVYAFVDVENCDVDDIIGSSICIATGWITWSIYALAVAYYLSNVREIIRNIPSCKMLETEYRVLNGFFYAVLILFFTTFFPVHILADNVEPISCGCVDSGNTSLTAFTCEERPGVLATRVTFFSYQLIILGAMGALGAAKYSLKQTKDN